MIRFSVVNETPDRLTFYKSSRHNDPYNNDAGDGAFKCFFVEPNGGEKVVDVPAGNLREWWPRIQWDLLPVPIHDDPRPPRVLLEGPTVGWREPTMTLFKVEHGETRGYYLKRSDEKGLRVARFTNLNNLNNVLENKMRFGGVEEGEGEVLVCPTRAVGGDLCWYPKQRGLIVLPRGLRPLDAFRPTWLYKGAGRFGIVAWRSLSGRWYDPKTDQWHVSQDEEDDAPCDFEAFGTLAGAVLAFGKRKDAEMSAETSDVATLAVLDLREGGNDKLREVAQIHEGRAGDRRRAKARAAKKRKTATALAIKNNVVQEEEAEVVGGAVLPLILELSVAFCGARASGVLALCCVAGRDLVIAEATRRAKAIDFESQRGPNWCFPKQQDKRGKRKELHYTASALFVLQPVEKWHSAYLKTRPKPLDCYSPPIDDFGRIPYLYQRHQAEDRALTIEFDKQKGNRALSTSKLHWAQKLYAAEKPCYARALPASGWDDPTTLRKLAQLLRANPRTGLEDIAQRFREHGGATCEASDVALWSRVLRTMIEWSPSQRSWILAKEFKNLPRAKAPIFIKPSPSETNQRTIDTFFKTRS